LGESVIVEAKNLAFSYFRQSETIQVLVDFSCSIGEPGKFIAIMAPSGSGKSTFLHLCGGLLKPQGGRLVVLGEDLSKKSEAERTIFRREKVGFVFQFFHLIPTFTALENVMVSHWMGRNRSYEEDSSWARKLLDDLGVGKRAHHYPFEMSGGEVQRVAVARALFNRPKLIIADEPVGNLDRNSRQAVLELLKDVTQKYDTCVIMATHDEDSVSYVDEAYRIEPSQLIPITVKPDRHPTTRIPASP
jgi:putative ABC transport system ATP-binding protein